MKIVGIRTLLFATEALVALVLGFWLLPDNARGAAYAFLAAGVGALMAAIAGKSSVESLAGGGGLQGAKDALLTSKKPEPPPPPATP